MGRFFDKNKSGDDTPEDFILFNSEDDTEKFTEEFDGMSSAEYDDTEQDTKKIDLNAVAAAAEEKAVSSKTDVASDITEENKKGKTDNDDYEYEYEEVNIITYFIRNHRILSMCAGVIVAALVLSASAYGVIAYTNPLRKYVQDAASKENVMRTMEVEGTLRLGEQYKITSLVAGKIISSEYEVGDEVKKDDVLYKIDDTDAKLSVERAQNDLAKASDSAVNADSSAGNIRIVATEAGVLQTLTIKQGSKVNAGSTIGTVLKTDGTTAPLVSYVSGTVSLLSVNVGRTLSVGQVIASLKSDTSVSSAESSKYDKKSGEIDVQSAQRQLENYVIKSPVSGIVVEKYNKVGDNVGMTNDDNPMMVIVDSSKLTFTFNVDEYRVREMEKGMEVNVTADSIPEQTFAGEITYVSADGKSDENGNPQYEVCVTVAEPGDLKAGMNVKAKVILASVKKAVSIPEKALLMSDGQNALVLVKNDEFTDDQDRFNDESFENELAYPEIKVPKGCSLVSVRYGISDGTIVEILSGIEVGDIVVYKADEDNKFVVASGSDSKSGKEKSDGEKEKKQDYSVDSKDDTSKDASEEESKIRDAIDDILKDTDEL